MRDAEVHLLLEEPPGARGVLEIKEDLASRDAPDQWTGVVLVARIGGVDDQTWDPNRAAFVAMDLSSIEEASQHAATEHDSNQCPFCQAKKKKLRANLERIQGEMFESLSALRLNKRQIEAIVTKLKGLVARVEAAESQVTAVEKRIGMSAKKFSCAMND